MRLAAISSCAVEVAKATQIAKLSPGLPGGFKVRVMPVARGLTRFSKGASGVRWRSTNTGFDEGVACEGRAS
jgi:hypothetical protein